MVARVRVSINHAALRRTMGEASARTLRETSKEVVALAKLHAPVGRTGKLAASIKATPVEHGPRRDVIRITASARSKNGKDYANFVLHGTGIYGPRRTPIRPVRAKYMRFELLGARFRAQGPGAKRQVRKRAGNIVYAQKVAGQRPQNFLRQALEETTAADPRLRLLRR